MPLTKPVILVTDLLDGSLRVTFSNNAGQSSKIIYQEAGDNVQEWGVDAVGNVYVDISGLTTEVDHYVAGQPYDISGKGPLSDIHTIKSKNSKIQNSDARCHMSKFIQNLLIRSTKFDWYTKMVKADGIPTSQLNMPFVGEPTKVQYNENVRVREQAEIFQCRGSIPICIQRTGGYNKADVGFGQVRMGDFTAFCAIEHQVEIDDRLIDSVNDIEYKVVHSTPHKDGLYRHLELKWLMS